MKALGAKAGASAAAKAGRSEAGNATVRAKPPASGADLEEPAAIEAGSHRTIRHDSSLPQAAALWIAARIR